MKNCIFKLIAILSFSAYAYGDDNKHNFNKFLPAMPAGVIIAEEVLPPILGAVAGAIAGSSTNSELNKSCPPCNPPVGEKFNIQIHKDHSHHPCTMEEGHWHYI